MVTSRAILIGFAKVPIADPVVYELMSAVIVTFLPSTNAVSFETVKTAHLFKVTLSETEDFGDSLDPHQLSFTVTLGVT